MEQLPRKLGLLDATLIVIGIVIGSGIFLLPNLIARSLPSGPAIIGVWVVAGVLSYFGALAYAELGAMMPATGGQYVYLREAYGPCCAFLCGWVFVLAVLPGGIAFLAVGFSIYLDRFIPLSPAMRVSGIARVSRGALGHQLCRRAARRMGAALVHVRENRGAAARDRRGSVRASCRNGRRFTAGAFFLQRDRLSR